MSVRAYTVNRDNNFSGAILGAKIRPGVAVNRYSDKGEQTTTAGTKKRALTPEKWPVFSVSCGLHVTRQAAADTLHDASHRRRVRWGLLLESERPQALLQLRPSRRTVPAELRAWMPKECGRRTTRTSVVHRA